MSDRRDPWAKTAVLRGELVATSPPSGLLAPGFLRELEAFDREAELHWNPVGQRWVLYRRVSRSAGRASNNVLIRECAVHGPSGEYRRPGRWLIEKLKCWDKTKNGALDPGRADHLFTQAIKDEAGAEEEKEDADRMKISEALADDLRYCAFGRASIVSNWESGK